LKRVFVSYSHVDEEWKNRLREFLDVQVRLNNLVVWDDREIRTGDEWNPEIEKAILGSDIALLLVTTNFLTSSFIQDKEIPFIQKHGLKIMPIIISPCAWEDFDYIEKPQGFTKNNQPLEKLSEFEIKEEFTRISKELSVEDKSNPSTLYNNSSLEEIVAILKEKYLTVKELKNKLFQYLERDNLGFKEILKADNFADVIRLLFKYKKESLYCIFQDLKIENSYVDRLKTSSCDEFKKRAEDNRQIQKIIFRIHQSSAGSVEKCWAEGWLLYDIDVPEPLDKLENINFNLDYTTYLADYLNRALENYIVKYPLNIDLVLDDEIFIKGFQKLAVDNQFNISIQFLSRHKNFFLPKKIATWRDNSDFFEEKKEEKIESYIYPIEEIYERGDIMNCFSDNKIVIIFYF
jgi:hypothetical protein